jgi:2-amino-4-hydroxy-6-hydroxymethyldihydropteridine diphosphokinase
MESVFVALGSNLGNKSENIERAIAFLKNTNGITVEKISSIIKTNPVAGPPQPFYLNAVIKIKTNLVPVTLLKKLQNIEEKLGRVRTIKNGPRPIDLDILLYGDKIINNKNLQVPHPRMFERPFVMKPLLEIEPGIAERIGLGAKRKTKC